MKKNLSIYTDKELVSMMQGDRRSSEAAFTEIYDRYSVRLNAYCRTILNNRALAEDVFQETLMKFYQNVRHDFSGSIIGYLITIARNLCLNQKRDARPTVPLEDFDFPTNEHTQYEDKEMADIVMMSLELLDPVSKEVMVLRTFNDLPYEEIAEILTITSARARYLAFNAKNKIRQIIAEYSKESVIQKSENN
ncbi:MAG: RNA polymerase sigma factor [Candidatus Kapabacteria bacterium]|nr:RNA polymerase sigma factor [Candidatus Kapabacteria bacterium]